MKDKGALYGIMLGLLISYGIIGWVVTTVLDNDIDRERAQVISINQGVSLVVFATWALGAILFVPRAGDMFSEMVSIHIGVEKRIAAEKAQTAGN